jgi:glycerol uptake facilitator-like aquaporin
MGDYHGAVQSAKQAKTWSMVSLGIGLGILVVYFFFGILAGLASSDY